MAAAREQARARLAVLRARAKARRDAYPGPWRDPIRDARLSEENAPFMALQAETDAWRGGDDEDSTGMPGATRGGWSLCCMGGLRRVLCWLDNVNHEYLGSRLRLVCDVHDRALTGMTLREVRRNGAPQ